MVLRPSAVLACFLLLFLPIVSGEVTENLSLESTNASIVTGLWGATINVTTSTTSTSSTTTTTIPENVTTTTSTTSTTTTIVENVTSTTTVPETVTTIALGYFSKTIVPNLTEDLIKQELTVAVLEKLEGTIGEIDVSRITELTLKHVAEVSIKYDLIVEENSSRLLTTIQYNGKRILEDFVVILTLPKSFAWNADEVEARVVGEDITPIILESDPTYLIVFPVLEAGKSKSIMFSVAVPVSDRILDETKVMFLVTKEREEVFSIFHIVVVVLVIVGLLYIFRDKLYALFEEKPRYRYVPKRKVSRVETLKAIGRRIKELFKRRKEEKVKFRYRYV